MIAWAIQYINTGILYVQPVKIVQRQVPKAVSRSVIKSFLYVVVADVIISIFYLVDYMNNLNQLI